MKNILYTALLVTMLSACANDNESNGNIDKSFGTEKVTSENNIDHLLNKGPLDEKVSEGINTYNKTDSTANPIGSDSVEEKK